MLTPTAMMDNLAEKVDECPLNKYCYCLRTIGGTKAVQIYYCQIDHCARSIGKVASLH